MSINNSNGDPYFECPFCGCGIRPIGENPIEAKNHYGEVQSYGCVTCGYVASFVKKRAEDYLESNKV